MIIQDYHKGWRLHGTTFIHISITGYASLSTLLTLMNNHFISRIHTHIW